MTASKTAKFTGSAPVIFVRDVHAAAEHYRDAMGFSFGKIWGEPPSFAILKRDNMYVMIKQIDDHKHIIPRWTVSAGLWDMYFWVDDVLKSDEFSCVFLRFLPFGDGRQPTAQ